MTQRTLVPADLDRRLAAFTAAVDAVPPTGWGRPSPCPDWVARDVVDHVIDTERDFLGRQGVALAALVALDPADRWHEHVTVVATALTPDVFDRSFAGYFGPTTIGATMIDFYGFDLIVHRWDLARAAGQDSLFSEEEMTALDTSIAQFGDAMYATGICAPAVTPPADADRQTTLLAVMGRAA